MSPDNQAPQAPDPIQQSTPPVPGPDAAIQPPIMQQPAQPVMPPMQPAMPMQPASVKRRPPKWLVIVGAVVAALAILGAVVYFVVMGVTSAPRKLSDEFMKDVQANNTAAAYAITSTEFKGTTSQQELGALFDNISPTLQGTFSQTGAEVVSKNGVTRAEVSYEVKGSSGKNYYTLVSLTDTSSGWQILGFKADQSPISIDLQ